MSVAASPAWQALTHHGATLRNGTASDVSLTDPARQEKFNIVVEGLRFNYAFQYATHETMTLAGRACAPAECRK